MKKIDLSIIIVNFKNRKLTLDCMKSIKKESAGLSFEVVLVDNGSGDGSAESFKILKSEKFWKNRLYLILNKSNLGYAKANNSGIEKAKGEFVFLLNNDTIVRKNALQNILRFAKKTPDAGVVGSRLLNKDGSLQSSCYHFPGIINAFKEFWFGKKGLFEKFAPKGKLPIEVDSVVGAAFLITPEARKKIGMLNEKYFAYFEDIDYCRQTRRKKLKVYYLPDSLITHYHGATFKKLEDEKKQWRKLIPSSKLYHGTLKHYLINFIIWLGQKKNLFFDFFFSNKKYSTIIPIILLVVLAFFLRIYRAEALYNYAHDNDLASWIVRDILENRHLRLVGQQTSVLGVFIGGLFYYLQIPFYVLGEMDPFYTVYLTAILGAFSVFSFYFVFQKIYNRKVGLIAALIYAVSKIIVFSDRGVYPTMPVMLWTVWFFYDIFLIYKGKQKSGFILFGVLFSLIWHMNIALYILTPLAFLSFLASGIKIRWRYFIAGVLVLIATSLPFILFELRHDFQQMRAIVLSLTTNKNLLPETGTGLAKLDRVMQLVHTNTTNVFLPSLSKVPVRAALFMLLAMFVFIVVAKKISKKEAVLFFLWQVLYIGFFSANSLNVSEYYLDGMNVIWIAIASVFLAEISEKKKVKGIITLVLMAYAIWNINLVLNFPPTTKGYVHRKALVEAIGEDAKKHNYPCISISYITSSGYNLGYRYLFYINNIHVNNPDSGSPVYTIVFPLSLVNSFDLRFGDIGLILPEYDKYDHYSIIESCAGQNSNLTDPMFGYTQ